jgi:hypothetical protein
MNKFTKKQKEAASRLIDGPVMDRDLMPGERRTLESLLIRGVIEKEGGDGRVTWKPNESTCLVSLSASQYKFARMMYVDGEVDMLDGAKKTTEDFKALYALEDDGFCFMDQSLPSEKYKRKRYVPTDKLKKAFSS